MASREYRNDHETYRAFLPDDRLRNLAFELERTLAPIREVHAFHVCLFLL